MFLGKNVHEGSVIVVHHCFSSLDVGGAQLPISTSDLTTTESGLIHMRSLRVISVKRMTCRGQERSIYFDKKSYCLPEI